MRSSLVSSASVTVSNTLGANVSNITSSKDNLTALSESHTALISVAPVTANIPISQSNVKTHQASITTVTPIRQSNVKVPQQTSIAAVTPLSQSNVKGTDHQSTRTVLTKHVGKWGEYTITSTSVQLSPENAYRNGLYRYKAAHKLKVGVYALAEHKENGCLTPKGRRKYVISWMIMPMCVPVIRRNVDSSYLLVYGILQICVCML